MYIHKKKRKKKKSIVSNKIFGTSRKDTYYIRKFLVILSVNNQPFIIL